MQHVCGLRGAILGGGYHVSEAGKISEAGMFFEKRSDFLLDFSFSFILRKEP